MLFNQELHALIKVYLSIKINVKSKNSGHVQQLDFVLDTSQMYLYRNDLDIDHVSVSHR